ncbi:PucR family transcriptional regulator [Actinokineospora spheciospongiae]|uniref:PucR family transcriptional regulator n=1 Tax=Actinokineospora spheciospongiae TaxID=909613 RepID=UPI000D714563|nr:helix-turn-helix domain-containing protein [Actinokineospora spheciospongiae]PWW66755.1 PucR-like helix-turn-helix protein [Actinokineospora spheciospongiae]
MTGHNSAAAESLAARLLADLPGLAATVTGHLAERLPVYRRLPAEELDGDVHRIVKQIIGGFARGLRTGRPPEPAQLAAIRASAAKRAEEGLPIDAVLSAYHLGAQACVDALLPETDPGEMAVVHRSLLDYLCVAVSEVAAGYLAERQALVGEDNTQNQTMLAALLSGADPEVSARRTGIRLPTAYFVVSAAIDPHPDELDPGVDAAVAGRRKTRRVRAELDRRCAHPALARVSADEGLLLVPCPDEPDPWAWLRALVEALGKAAGAPVLACATHCAPADVPAAARLAAELREVATAFHRPPGLHRLDDLLLEHQLTRPGPARRRLAALLTPLLDKPDLLPTLRLYLATNLNRRQTAGRLQVHPNTIDYRIRRIAELTSLNPTRHEDLFKLTAALAAHAAEGNP